MRSLTRQTSVLRHDSCHNMYHVSNMNRTKCVAWQIKYITWPVCATDRNKSCNISNALHISFMVSRYKMWWVSKEVDHEIMWHAPEIMVHGTLLILVFRPSMGAAPPSPGRCPMVPPGLRFGFQELAYGIDSHSTHSDTVTNIMRSYCLKQ